MEASVFYSSHPVERMRPPTKLMHSLFELCVLIGLDEDTGAVTVNQSRKSSETSTPTNDNGLEEVLYSKAYQPHILAVLSAQIASFPQCNEPINGEPYYLKDHVAFNSQGSLSPAKSHSSLRFQKPVEIPFGSDVIFSLPQFCLPAGVFAYETKPEETMHSLVLTDFEGNRSYCICLTYYQKYYAFEDPFIREKFQLSVKEPEYFKDQCLICYVPKCCCLISRFPYFQIAKDCLSSFLPVLNLKSNDMRRSLMKLCSQLCIVPIPPPGPVNIEFMLCGQNHTLRSSREPKKHIIDMEFHLPFLCFSVDDILLLLSCVLTQKRIVFMSSNYSLLTPITEALLSYIQPLVWGITYVPVLPSNLIDLLEAPGSFIMGCHSDHTMQVYQLLNAGEEGAEIVIADIDEGLVLLKEKVELIPEIYQKEFKQKIKKIKFHFDLSDISNISASDIDELKKRRQEFNKECANNILQACFDLMLNIFSEFGHFIKSGDASQRVLFDRVAFVDSKAEIDREFFKQLCESHAFSTYLCGRYEEDEVDFFSTAMSETEQGSSVAHRKRSVSTTPGSLQRKKSSSLQKITDNVETFSLTKFVNEGLHTGRFYDNCIKDLSVLIEAGELKSSSCKACYLYLRGMMYVANGQIYQALDDFFALQSKSMQLFPTNTIVDILTQFDTKELEKLRNKSYFRRVDLLLRKHKKVGDSVRTRKRLIFDGVPRYTVGKNEFVERVLLCQITESTETAERLFKALVSGREKKTIDSGTFSGLYETLNQADLEAQSVDVQGLALEKQEFIIKVSLLCKTDFGVGRLVLTNIRLLFMADGGSKCAQISRHLDIKIVEKYQHYSILPPGVPALRIIKKDKAEKTFGACLKTERDLWYSYLKEMSVCHERAEGLRDSQFISLGAQNVILTDALIRSGLPRSTAVMMCYFTNEDKPKEISGDTEKFLLQRLNPSEKDTKTTTVEALVYIPRNETNHEQIWCGMASGTIVIFKRESTEQIWSYDKQMLCAKDRVSCLLVINDKYVWAGSFDATIYIIDRCSYKANQHLEEHSDMISAMIYDQQRSIVWSASLNGQIIGWNISDLAPIKKMKIEPAVRTLVSFVMIDKEFWCDIRNHFVIVDNEGDGKIKNTFIIKDEKKHPLSIDCIVHLSHNRILCGVGKTNRMALIDTSTQKYSIIPVELSHEGVAFTKISVVLDEVWVGNRNGDIFTLDINCNKNVKSVKQLVVKRTLKIHDDSVRSICVISGGFVATGPGSRDGKIAIWRQNEETEEEMGFERINHDIVRSHSNKTSSLPCENTTKFYCYAGSSY